MIDGYQYCIQSVCVQQVWKIGVQRVESSGIIVGDLFVHLFAQIGDLP